MFLKRIRFLSGKYDLHRTHKTRKAFMEYNKSDMDIYHIVKTEIISNPCKGHISQSKSYL